MGLPLGVVALWAFLGLPAAAQVNLARNQPAISSGANWGGLTPAALTDGDPNTFVYPAEAAGTTGFFYQVDLGGTFRIDRILLRNRADGCCPERLSNYRVEIHAAGDDDTGGLVWSAARRTDGSNSGSGGVDTIDFTQLLAGPQAGRYVRVVNLGGLGYSPQIAEIEVHGGRGPVIQVFAADQDLIPPGGSTTLRWRVENAIEVRLDPGNITVPSSSGSVVVRPATTTTYTLVAINPEGTTTATVSVGVGEAPSPPDLTEFLADSADAIRDEDGDTSDWIEVSNRSPFVLDLAGYALTDDPANLRKWVFPSVKIAARGFLLVRASGKDRRDPRAQLHTNFKLDSKGDYLALVDLHTNVVRQYPGDYPKVLTFPGQRAGVSYGIGSNGLEGFQRPPTPGSANGLAYEGVVSDTKFSRDRGFYDTNIVVEITNSTPGSVIRYTIDRSLPTATKGLVYSGPILVTNTTVLRAAAFRDGWAPSNVDTHTYLYPSNVIASAVMRKSITTNALYRPQMKAALLDVPSVSVVAGATINGSLEVPMSFEWLRPDGKPGIQEDGGIRLYGGAFTDFAKKSFRLYFSRQYGASKIRYPFFKGYDRGLAAVEEFDQLELRNCSHDMEQRGFYMSNACTDDTLLEMGQLNPHGRFVHLYLNGTYWGLYHLRERWGAGMHSRYLGGSSTNYESINGNWNVGGWADPGTPYDGDGSVWKRIKELRGNYNAVRPWLDVPQYVDYMVMWMFGGSEDEYRCVGPNVPGSGFKFYLNDADGWFCVPTYCAAGNRTARSSPGKQAGDGPGSVFSMLFKEGHPEYRTLLADRIHRALFNEGALTPGRNIARLTNRCDEIQRAFLAESARWGYLTPTEWASRRDSVLKTWLPRRTAEALSQYRSAGFYPSLDAPVLQQHGGIVAAGTALRFAGPTAGTVWFTTDGSDPRLVGGEVSPRARRYSIGGSAETVIPAGAVWRWFTSAAGLGASEIVPGHPSWSTSDWKHPDFVDLTWSQGPGQLGYGEGDEATKVPFGPDASAKWITAYFRHRFTVSNPATIVAATLQLRRDDGAIVYLNGREVARQSIGAGVVTATTLAENAADDGQGLNPMPLDPAWLRDGENVLAVEVHQSGPGSSDLSFDLELGIARAGGSAGELPVVAFNTLLRSRTRSGTQWSALDEAFFQVGPDAVAPGEVVVGELHFNPAGDDAGEFLELVNRSQRAVNLRGARFTEGITFAFPSNRDTVLVPGQRLVLVGDLFAFQQRHGWELPVGGIFSGSLSNGGERLALVSASGAVLFSFEYDGRQPWPTGADGGGYSLVLARPELGLDHPQAWRTSRLTNGTPGGSDGFVFAGDPEADLDQDGLAAFFEHALGTSDQAPESGPDAIRAALDAEGRFTLQCTRNLGADEALLTVEQSQDLGTWSRSTLLGTETRSDGRAVETWGVPETTEGPLFLRVRVERRSLTMP